MPPCSLAQSWLLLTQSSWMPCSRVEQMEAEYSRAAREAAAASAAVELPSATDLPSDRPYAPPAAAPAWRTEGTGGAWYSGNRTADLPRCAPQHAVLES
jgi:hypothetical protein